MFLRLPNASFGGLSRSERRFTADESTGPSRRISAPAVEARKTESVDSPRGTAGRTRDLDFESGRCILLVIWQSPLQLLTAESVLGESKSQRAKTRNEVIDHAAEVLCTSTLHPVDEHGQ